MASPSARADGFPLHQAEFVTMMAALQALQALAIDVMLPALGVIARDLDASDPNERQLIVGVFLIFAGIGTLVPGAVADRFGRRPVVLTALSAYVLCSIACAVAGSFTLLLVSRALMGLSSSALMVMPMTILRDRYEGDSMARTQSLVAVIFMIVPMLAPMLGQAVLMVASWRWIFGVMALWSALVCLWVLLRLPETLRDEFRQGIRPQVIARNMASALTVRASFGYFFGAAFIYGGLLGYINSAQQLVAEHFAIGSLFPVVFGAMALVMAGTNFVNSRIVETFGARRVSHAALLCYIGLAAIHYVLARDGEAFWTFAVLMSGSMCMMSFIGANFQAISLQPFARTAGAAASAMSFVRMSLAAVLGAIIGQAYDGSARTITLAMLLSGIGTLVLVFYSEHGRLFRRVNPPGFYKNTPPPLGN